MTAIMPDNTVSNETKADSVGSMLVNIFLSPMRVFGSIKAKPTWIIPFVILLLATAVTAYVVAPLAMEMQKQQIMTSDKYTPEQREQAVQQMETFKGIGADLRCRRRTIRGSHYGLSDGRDHYVHGNGYFWRIGEIHGVGFARLFHGDDFGTGADREDTANGDEADNGHSDVTGSASAGKRHQVACCTRF